MSLDSSTYLVLNAGGEVVLAENEDIGRRRRLGRHEGGGGSQTGRNGGTRETHLEVVRVDFSTKTEREKERSGWDDGETETRIDDRSAY